MQNIIFLILITIIYKSLSQKTYIKKRLKLNNLVNLYKFENYFFVISFEKYKRGENLHFFFRISEQSFQISKIKYSYTQSKEEPEDLDFPKSTLEIKKYLKRNHTEFYISYYFDIIIPQDKTFQQLIIIIEDISNLGYFLFNEFDESEYEIIRKYENNTFKIKENKPLFIVSDVSEFNNYYLQINSSSKIYLNISYKESTEKIDDFIIFPKEFFNLSIYRISQNNESNYYSEINITTKNINIIYLIIKPYSLNLNEISNEEINIKFTEKYDLGIGTIHINKTLTQEIISESLITLIQYEVNNNTYLYDYYMLKYPKKSKSNILNFYYSKTKNNYTTNEYNITLNNFICSENEHNETIYKRCKMPKSNSKSVILILYSIENTYFKIYQKTHNDTLFETMEIYSTSKKYYFKDKYDYHILTIGNIKYNEVFYLKFHFNDYDSTKEFLISINNNDLKEYYENPLVKRIDNDAFIKLGNDVISYYHSKNDNFSSGIKSIYLIFRMNKGNWVFIESKKFNEHSFKNYTFKKNESIFINNHDGINTYIAFDISQFNINETFFIKFKSLSQNFVENIIYYYFDYQEITFDDFNYEYNISEKCFIQKKEKESIFYCNYTKIDENDNSIRFIVLLNPGSDLSVFNIEKYEIENDKSLINLIVVFIIFIFIALSISLFLYNKKKKNLDNFNIEETGKLIE